MRLLGGTVLLALLVFVGLGCEGTASREKAKTLGDRLKAAEAITDPQERDQALEAVAREAVGAGQVEVVKESLKKMRDEDLRNQVAGEAALALFKKDKGDAANEIAKLIGDPDKRDSVLEKIAKGTPDAK